MTATDTLTALTTAIDEGDDDAMTLLAWADRLEEDADPRAAGLRLVGDRRPLQNLWAKRGPVANTVCPLAELSPSVYEMLRGGRLVRRTNWPRRRYPTRHEAFLALAEALMEAKAVTTRMIRTDDGLISQCGTFAVRKNASAPGNWVAIDRRTGTAQTFRNRKDARRQVECWLREAEKKRNG